MIDEIGQELEGLKKKALWLKQLRDENNKKTREYLEERNNLNTQHSGLVSEARLEQKLRDEINKKVAENKEEKTEFKQRISELVQKVKHFKEQKQGIKAPNNPPRNLEQQITSIEWKIQTTVLDLKKERELISRVSELERALEEQKKHDDIDSRIIETLASIETLKSNILLINNKIIELAEAAQMHHKNMIGFYDDAKRVKEKADTIHLKFLETRKLANEYHQKYLELRKQMKEMVQKIHEQKSVRRKEKHRRQEELLKEKAKKAFEKLKVGGKLSFDEFAMLVEQGLI
ncbi:MAG: coiled-coil protein [Promethearchaeota archaeon]